MGRPFEPGWQHAMVVGGTGMLAGASRFITAHARVASWLARSPESLAAATEGIPRSERCARLVVDYREVTAFARCIAARVAEVGSPDLVLAWFHSEEPALRLAKQLAAYGTPLRFFHVLGSDDARPDSNMRARRARFEVPGMAYRSIALGFMHDPSGSRWLTHEEISHGVIEAVHSDALASTVRMLDPWSLRP